MNQTPDIQSILKQYWQYDNFRPKQEEIIRTVLTGNDCLALLPTGGGKSICFQVPALAQEGICLVISPLIALMQDQIANLKKKGIKALAISSAMSAREIDITLDNAAYGNYKFLYLSPERLETELFKARLPKMNISFIAVDEAHCISQWGYDFRPAYLNIAKLREQLPGKAILALTATATPEVVTDIQKQLAFEQENVIKQSFERKNLAYVVVHEEDPFGRMFKVFDGVPGSGIVYVSTRKKCKEIAALLNSRSYSASYYHGGLNHEERSAKQLSWINNQSRIMVATNAFGMGIDKPDVRSVVHLDIPDSLEAYFQEAGRAGRDGKKSYAVMIHSPSASEKLKQQVERSFPDRDKIKACYQVLCNYLQVPIDGGKGQSFALDFNEFTKEYQLDLIETYHALHFLEKEGYISLSENFALPSRLFIRLGKEDLYKFQVSNQVYDAFIKNLLRTYGGLFDNYVPINEFQIAKNSKRDKKQVIKILERLKELEVLDYQAQNNLPRITFNKARLEQKSLIISKKNYSDRKKVAQNKLDAILNYIHSDQACRSQLLLAYFGEKSSSLCGMCDYCLNRKKEDLDDKTFSEISNKIFALLQGKPQLLPELLNQLDQYPEAMIISVITELSAENKIMQKAGKLSLPK